EERPPPAGGGDAEVDGAAVALGHPFTVAGAVARLDLELEGVDLGLPVLQGEAGGEQAHVLVAAGVGEGELRGGFPAVWPLLRLFLGSDGGGHDEEQAECCEGWTEDTGGRGDAAVHGRVPVLLHGRFKLRVNGSSKS